MAKRFDDREVVKDLSQGGQAWTYLVKKAGGGEDELFVLKRLIKKGDFSRLSRGSVTHSAILRSKGTNKSRK